MKIPTDAELHEIVQRVLQRTVSKPTVPKRSEDTTKVQLSSYSANSRSIAIGADHGGFEMKEALMGYLQNKNYEVVDYGTYSRESVDYPDIAQAVAEKVSSKESWRGIIIDGAGIGSCMAANKVSGVRAALCYDYATAHNSREHNDANVLTLGAGLIGSSLAKQIVDTFLLTDFGGGRHARRVDKIMSIEKKI